MFLINSYEAECSLKTLKVNSVKSRKRSFRPKTSSSTRDSSEETKLEKEDCLTNRKVSNSTMLNDQMRSICKAVAKEMCFHMNLVKGCFEMMRFNFIIDKNLTPVLKNINCNFENEVNWLKYNPFIDS